MQAALIYPEYAYLPGRTPRHPEGWFDAIRDTVRPGLSVPELAQTSAWHAELAYLEQGFFWEAHEVLEPVWMALPQGSAERELVQALIQLANACLKREMGRPRAVLRLCAMVARHLDRVGDAPVMGQTPSELRIAVRALENQIRRDAPNLQNSAI